MVSPTIICMRIALFTDTYLPEANGVAVSVATLHEGLRERAHEVTVFTPSHPNAPESEGLVGLPSLAFRPIPDHRVATPVDPRIGSRIRSAGFDLIHTHTEFSVGQFGFRAAAQLKIPQVHTYHTTYEDYTWYVTRGHAEKQARKIVRLASRYFCDRCDYVIAPSEKTRAMLGAYRIATPIRVIPTGVDTQRFAAAQGGDRLRADLGIDPQAKVLLTLGRVAYEKNIVKLLDAVADYLQDTDRDLVFLVVGDGPALGALQKQAARRGVSERVHFTGAVPWEEVGRYYRAADVFVSFSESETQGLTYLEALAAGCPVLAWYNECFDGILEDGQSASLLRQPEEFGPRLDEVLFDEQRRARYLARGAEAAQALSIASFVDKIEAVYEETRASYVPRPSTLRRVFF